MWFSKSHRPTTQRGLRDPESHFWRGERREMVLFAPTPMRARRGPPSLWPRAGRKVAQGSVLQRPLPGERHLVCGGGSGVKIICGTGRGREKAFWGRSPLGVTGLEGPPPPAVPIWGVWGVQASQAESSWSWGGLAAGGREGRPKKLGVGGQRLEGLDVLNKFSASAPAPQNSGGAQGCRAGSRGGGPARTPGALPGRSLPPLPVGRPSEAPVPPRRAQPRCPRWGLPLAARRVARASPALAGPRGY